MVPSPTPKGDEPSGCPSGKTDAGNPLRIVRAKEEGDALDLDLEEAETDRRFGREDIADK